MSATKTPLCVADRALSLLSSGAGCSCRRKHLTATYRRRSPARWGIVVIGHWRDIRGDTITLPWRLEARFGVARPSAQAERPGRDTAHWRAVRLPPGLRRHLRRPGQAERVEHPCHASPPRPQMVEARVQVAQR
jgi:hypothetical protein